MNFRPSEHLTESQIQSGLKLVIKDGLAAEAMATLTGGAFLVAMAMSMGASNVQIGILAALPTFANISQLAAIWLVQRYNNRRAIAVVCSFFARFPLLAIGLMPFLFSEGTSVQAMIFLLFFHYSFGAISGASWNSWMKDLVPERMLGSYFSHRTRLVQLLNLTLSLVLALALDYIKKHDPSMQAMAYSIMFVAGGLAGLLGVYVLARTPEPVSYSVRENIFKLISKPLRNKNFRKLLVFNSFWSFALNLATPFFTVFMMKTVGLSLFYVIGLSMLSQLCSILFLKVWGVYSDRYSNKTIIRICAPVYIACMVAWTFVTNPTVHAMTLPLLLVIHIISGIATAGINLAMNNIVLKLAPREDAISYIAARNMITAFFPALAPVAGGLLADFFAQQQLSWRLVWDTATGPAGFYVFNLRHWDFFFLIGAVLAVCSLKFLKQVHEQGEAQKAAVVAEMAVNMRGWFSKRRLAFLPKASNDEQEQKRA